MSEQPPETTTETASSATPLLKTRRSLPRRLGCYFALILWFGLILSPCLCIVLASQGEIAVQLGDPPGDSLRIWLVNEAQVRGIGISRPIIHNVDGNDAVCVETDVSFVLWQGEGQPTHYCECYNRPQGASDWTPTSTNPNTCPA